MESVQTLNKRLLEHYGRFEDGRANWRVVWADDELEKRETEYSQEGFLLPRPTILEMKKYPFDSGKYILEKLEGIPDGALTDLASKTSYEPKWTFEDKNHNPLPPDWDVIFIVVNTVEGNLARGRSPFPKYKDNETAETRRIKAEKIYEELYGNETTIGDSLHLDSAVGYGVRQRKDWLK